MTNDLQVPSPEVIQMTGFGAELLAQYLILPQAYRLGYKLVVANLEIVDQNAFETIGVPIVLGDARKIELVWQMVFQSTCSLENLLSAYREYTSTLPRRFACQSA